MTVRIVTDSASDLTHDEATALGIDVVPVSYTHLRAHET